MRENFHELFYPTLVSQSHHILFYPTFLHSIVIFTKKHFIQFVSSDTKERLATERIIAVLPFLFLLVNWRLAWVT
jgi:hypothetical protein